MTSNNTMCDDQQTTTGTTNDQDSNEHSKEQTEEPVLNDALIRPSIKLLMIRHAESRNNEVYRDARYIYRGGTPDFDSSGWEQYVNTYRTSDPGLSKLGVEQSQLLANYLVPYLIQHSNIPIQILVSPMKRTCETIRPTLMGLSNSATQRDNTTDVKTNVTVHGFYFESEGCHTKDVAEEGMNPEQIKKVLLRSTDNDDDTNESNTNHTATTNNNNNVHIDFVGFTNEQRGWYSYGTGPETRIESEQRAAKFYVWLCEYLDQQLYNPLTKNNIIDAGSSTKSHHDSEDHTSNTTSSTTSSLNKTNIPRVRVHNQKRQIQLLIGHGDFMSLVLKRIVSSFGHSVETMGIPHRSAFVHWNTGITELEYFGHGRFLIMHQNSTPHIVSETMLSGGSLKDGWSYLMPSVLNAEVSIAFSDEELDDHVLEQRDALKALYLSSKESENLLSSINTDLKVEDDKTLSTSRNCISKPQLKQFIVKRGLQVVGVATYSEETGHVSDVAIKPSAGTNVVEVLFNAVKDHTKKIGRSGSLLVFPRTSDSKQLFESVGFVEVNGNDEDHMELIHE